MQKRKRTRLGPSALARCWSAIIRIICGFLFWLKANNGVHKDYKEYLQYPG